MPALSQEEILRNFTEEIFRDGILQESDSIGANDETLLRFLRARKFDIKQAKVMLANCQQWRKTVEGVGIDELYRRIDPFDYPEREAVFQCWPMWFHKTDKKGRPLNVHFLGGMNIQRLHKACTPEKHWQTVLVNAESLTREILPAASRKAGHEIDTVFVVVDLKGFSVSQFWQMKGLVQKSFQISQDYYPETMGQLAIVNAPSSFTFIWSMIKPWLSKETVAKVEVLGSDYEKVLLNLVDEDCLPSVLGGSCKCEGLGGCHLSGVGPWLEDRVGWGPKAAAANVVRDADTKERVSLDSVGKSDLMVRETSLKDIVVPVSV
ncbi:CRAL/TRIO domain-containing protein [Pluteus cervinus]|uniref:CRAL/TRIO domain-containing protein n=1 Tax=Pluteus cervinus TaxID=181527 RepID=A0ACD3BAM0_9AGAR|nr:CRAL/TRIO domain-containing protein [Pluteus cervinus]